MNVVVEWEEDESIIEESDDDDSIHHEPIKEELDYEDLAKRWHEKWDNEFDEDFIFNEDVTMLQDGLKDGSIRLNERRHIFFARRLPDGSRKPFERYEDSAMVRARCGKTIQWLVDQGGSINARFYEMTLSRYNLERRGFGFNRQQQYSVIKKLLELGADPNEIIHRVYYGYHGNKSLFLLLMKFGGKLKDRYVEGFYSRPVSLLLFSWRFGRGGKIPLDVLREFKKFLY